MASKENCKCNKILPNVLEAIGNTALIKLNKIPSGLGYKQEFLAKCDFYNPGGSLKDRIALRMIENAENEGKLKPGWTIIVPTSGNTGISMALLAAVKGYGCIIVMTEKMSLEKESVINVLGAKIERTPCSAESFSPEGVFGVCYRLNKEIKNSLILDQYTDQGNPESHYDTTAEEIIAQCDGKLDMVVIGAGTGGCVAGVGKKIKEKLPNCTVVGVDPDRSILATPDQLNEKGYGFYEVEGIGHDFVSKVLDQSYVDFWIKTDDAESLKMARKLIKEEGLLVGNSSGATMSAALRASKNLPENSRIVVMFADSIRNYMTKFISDQWMEARDLQIPANPRNLLWWDMSLRNLLLDEQSCVNQNDSIEKVHETMVKRNLNQIVILDDQNNVVGVITKDKLLNSVITKKASKSDKVSKVAIRIYPRIFKNSTLGVLSRVLETSSYVVIEENIDSHAFIGLATIDTLYNFSIKID